jgi:tyrosine-protein kinase Etk/Wzc
MNNTNDNTLNLLIEFFRDLLKYWYIMLLSLAIMLGGALFYIKFASKIYKVTASVVLDIERSNAFGAKSEDMMRVNELIEHDKNLQNEIYFLKSSPLIKSVVEDMDLQVSYYLQEDKIPKEIEFSMKDLYDRSPFLIIPDKEHLQPVDLYIYIQIIDEEKFGVAAETSDATIVDFSNEKVLLTSTPFRIGGIYKFGEQVGNTFASFKVLLNSNYKSEAYQGKDLFFKFNTNSNLTLLFRGALDVEASALDATVVDMSLNIDNVQKGIDFLNGLISKYIDNNLEKKNYLAKKTIEHLDYQLADISQSLGSSEQELQNIRRSSSVMNIDEKAGNIYNQLQTAQTQKDETERTRSYLIQMQDYFTSNRDSTGFLAPSAMGLDDPLLSSLIGELTSMNAERQQIINNNQLRSPRLRTLDITISNLKDVIIENLQYSINASNSELREVNGRIAELNREFSSLPYTQRRLLGIERKFNLSENVYMSLLEQRIQAQIIKASTLPDCEVVEPPQYAGIHAPKKIIILIGALFMGFLLPSLFILIRKFFANKIVNKEELKKYTRMTQIGSIPQNSKGIINVVAEQPNSITAEAFHSLRSNIIYYLMGKTKQVILVTSTNEGEGKSFSALNIASSLSITNNKTVLVEFDLRRPSEIYTKIGIRGLIGVSSYLINKATLEEITISTDVPNLDVILAGQIPPNPIELISSAQTSRLFDELRKTYDYIIIDTPPYGLLTDSFVLMKYADFNIYVTRLGFVKKRMLLSCLDDIATKGIKNLHLLINGDIPKKGVHGKYYTYHKKDGVFKRSAPRSSSKRSKKSVASPV